VSAQGTFDATLAIPADGEVRPGTHTLQLGPEPEWWAAAASAASWPGMRQWGGGGAALSFVVADARPPTVPLTASNPDPHPNPNPNPDPNPDPDPNPNPNSNPNPNPNPNQAAQRERVRAARVSRHGQSVPWAVPQLGSCTFSKRAWRLWAALDSQKEAGTLGAQPSPRVLELAASKAANSTAFDHADLSAASCCQSS